MSDTTYTRTDLNDHGVLKSRFSWVALQIESLRSEKITFEADIRELLQHLPSGLMSTYSTIYDQIMKPEGPTRRRLVQRAIRLLLCTQQQLSTDEFLAAASLESRTKFTEVSQQQMVSMCRNLVVFEEQEGVFRFSHLSAREFLERREESAIELAHASTAEICLLFCLYSSPDMEVAGKPLFKARSFHEYAYLHWATHCRMSGKYIHEGRLQQLFDEFISRAPVSEGSHFAKWSRVAQRYVQKRDKSDPIKLRMESAFSSPPHPFLLGCAWGLSGLVELRFKSDREAMNQQGQHCLRIASECDQLEVVRILLVNGIPVDMKSRDGGTALHGACVRGYDNVVQLLLERGADVKIRDNSGKMALHHASMIGSEATVKLLLERRGLPQEPDHRGWTALHYAAYKGHDRIIELLLHAGANTEAQVDYGCTALYLAAEQGHEAVTRLLIDCGAAVNTPDEHNSSPLDRAVQRNHEGLVELLLKSGALPENPETLHSAADRGSERILKLLIEHKADIDAEDFRGMRALHRASIRGHLDVVKLLLASGAEMEIADENGCTPLYFACAGGHERVVKLLLCRGAEVNAREEGGKTPLHEASHGDFDNIVHLLVAAGADINGIDNTGRSSIHYAAVADTGTVMRTLLEAGADAEQTDSFGWTAWHWAAMEGRDAVIRVLIDHYNGVVYEGVDQSNRTALDWALERDYQSVVSILEEGIADFFDARSTKSA